MLFHCFSLLQFLLVRVPEIQYRIYTSQTEKMRRLLFVYPLVTFSRDVDHKFWQLKLVLNVNHNSTQLMLITTDCAFKTNQFAVTFSCHMVKRSIFFHWSFGFPPFLSFPGIHIPQMHDEIEVSYGLMHPRSLIPLISLGRYRCASYRNSERHQWRLIRMPGCIIP